MNEVCGVCGQPRPLVACSHCTLAAEKHVAELTAAIALVAVDLPGVHAYVKPRVAAKLQGEVDRLHKALTSIAEHGYVSAKFTTPEEMIKIIDWMLGVAKAALDGVAPPHI